MLIRLMRPPRMEAGRIIMPNEHVRLWISGRCDGWMDSAPHPRGGPPRPKHDPNGDTARLEFLDYEFDPLCRHCHRPV